MTSVGNRMCVWMESKKEIQMDPLKYLVICNGRVSFLSGFHRVQHKECAKLSSRQRVATLKNLKYIDLFKKKSGYYMIPYVLFHSFDVFTIILQCRK
jgi:hypothetical protein